MTHATPPLSYAPRDPRRLRCRRLRIAAVIAGAIAVGVVGRMLYARVAPTVSARLDLLSAQRVVDALPAHGVAVDASTSRPATATALAPAARRFMAAHQTSQAFVGDVWIGRLDNAPGQSRYLCVRIDRQRLYRTSDPTEVAVAILTVADPATPLRNGRGVRALRVRTLAIFASTFRLDAPRADGGRLLLNGTADDKPFAYAATIDELDNVDLVPVSP